MKFTIELDEFYIEGGEDGVGGGDIEKQLKSHIVFDVVRQINEKIKDQVQRQITEKIVSEMKDTMALKIEEVLTKIITTETFVPYGSKEEISISDYIKKQFEANQGWRSPYEAIKSFAKTFGDELKQRYDMAFASQIVAKLHEHSMLTDDVASKILITDKAQ